MVELKKVDSEDNATVGNGQKVESMEVGCITGMVTDKKEKKL